MRVTPGRVRQRPVPTHSINSGSIVGKHSTIAVGRTEQSRSTTSSASAQHDISYLIDFIKDAAGQKGTGKWTTEAAMALGVPIPTINAAVDARIISGSTEFREAHKGVPEEIEQPYLKPEKLVSRVRTTLDLSIIVAYVQGFELMKKASEDYKWNLDLSAIARIWSGGCIIRSALLPLLQKLYRGDRGAKQELMNRLSGERQLDWRRVIAIGTGRGIPLPAMASALAYHDALRRERLPQNLIQAQRDFFGAHTYERVDKKGTFHTEWL